MKRLIVFFALITPVIACLSGCDLLVKSDVASLNAHASPSEGTSVEGTDGHEAHAHDHGDHKSGGHGEEHAHKIVVTAALAKDIISTQTYVCQIHSCRHIEVRAIDSGYLEEIPVKEGQWVKKGDSLFQVVPALYQAKLEAELAEAQLVQIEYNNAKKLFDQKVVSEQEVALAQAKLSKAMAQVKLSQAELNFANVKAPFNGLIDRLNCQQGSLIAEGDILTTLSDNSVMWVYFNVPEARYLEYHSRMGEDESALQIELLLADHKKFSHNGTIGAIEADFNSETGNIAFRADFPNPEGLLRHGQTGNVLIHRTLKDAIVIPQRATFEILAKRYVYIVDADNVIHQREIVIQNEQDDIFVIQDGLKAGEKIILEGIRQVRDGDKVEYEFLDPVEVLSNLKNKAE